MAAWSALELAPHCDRPHSSRCAHADRHAISPKTRPLSTLAAVRKALLLPRQLLRTPILHPALRALCCICVTVSRVVPRVLEREALSASDERGRAVYVPVRLTFL